MPHLIAYNLFVVFDSDKKREIWYNEDGTVRFTMPTVEELDEYPVDDLFHFMATPPQPHQ